MILFNYKMPVMILAVVMSLLSPSAGCRTSVPAAGNNMAQPTPTPTKAAVEGTKKDAAPAADELARLASRAGVSPLRDVELSGNRSEVRIWIRSTPEMTRGLILRESEGIHLTAEKGSADGKFRHATVTPDGGWGAFWKLLREDKVLGVQGAPASDTGSSEDPEGIVVEAKTGKDYSRRYFASPCFSRSADAVKLDEALNAINESLGVEFYHCRQ